MIELLTYKSYTLATPTGNAKPKVAKEYAFSYNHRTYRHENLTMYKNNSRESSKLKGCSPLQLSCSLTGKCHEVGYYSYTQR